MNLKFTIEGETQISRSLQGIENRNFTKEFEASGKKLVKFYSGEVFNTEGAVIGEKWVGGPRYHKLQITGKMRNSFQHTASPSMLIVENTDPKFGYHQSNKPRTKLPRRVMLKLDNLRKTWIVKEIQKGSIAILQRRSISI